MKIVDSLHRDYQGIQQVRGLRDQIKDLQKNSPPQFTSQLAELDSRLEDLQGTGGGYAAAFLSTPQGRGLERLNAGLSQLLGIVDSADQPPTSQAVKMFSEVETALNGQLASLDEIRKKQIPDLNTKLKEAGLTLLKLESQTIIDPEWAAPQKAAGEE